VGGGGILVYSYSNPRIENNIITDNHAPIGGGIYCSVNASPVFVNNTIAYNTATGNGGGISCESNSDPILLNNILYGNSATAGGQLYIADINSDPIVAYSDIQGGKDGFGGPGAGADYTGLYENNIDTDPLFMNAASDDYTLSNSSHCIGAGIDSTQVAGVWYHAPSFCFGGNPRPSPAGTKPDIGACENLLGSPLVGVDQERTNPTGFVLYQNYPNPFNPSTEIRYQVPGASWVTLRVYDLLGKEVSTLVNERKPAGSYGALFDGSEFASGVYLCRLEARQIDGEQAGSFVQTKRMILLK
jgi:parallel beta-helix repeat protein